jgi:hypothetical protein
MGYATDTTSERCKESKCFLHLTLKWRFEVWSI